MTQALFQPRDILSVDDLSKGDLLFLLDSAKIVKETPRPDLLRGCLLGSCFFEPSTRTRLSFEAAMRRLGGDVVGFSEAGTSAAAKGESLHDTARIIGQYVDLLVIRHPLEGAARLAAEATDKPVINAGDGANQHPTQTLLDLFTIRESQETLDELHIALMGDLRFGRTVHSLTAALAHFNARLYFLCPPGLEMPTDLCHRLREKGLRYSFHKSLDEIIEQIDILYMTRLQRERFEQESFASYSVTSKMLQGAKGTMRILHPLPRTSELPREVDSTPHALYFEQAKNGLFVRQALLTLLLERWP